MIDIDREKVKEAYKELKSYRKVARMFNVSYMTIQRIVKDVTKSSKTIEIRKLKKIKEYINPILNDICITCKCFKEMQNCWQCDYEHHRNEISNCHSNYNLANEILKIIEEQE